MPPSTTPPTWLTHVGNAQGSRMFPESHAQAQRCAREILSSNEPSLCRVCTPAGTHAFPQGRPRSTQKALCRGEGGSWGYF